MYVLFFRHAGVLHFVVYWLERAVYGSMALTSPRGGNAHQWPNPWLSCITCLVLKSSFVVVRCAKTWVRVQGGFYSILETDFADVYYRS